MREQWLIYDIQYCPLHKKCFKHKIQNIYIWFSMSYLFGFTVVLPKTFRPVSAAFATWSEPLYKGWDSVFPINAWTVYGFGARSAPDPIGEAISGVPENNRRGWSWTNKRASIWSELRTLRWNWNIFLTTTYSRCCLLSQQRTLNFLHGLFLVHTWSRRSLVPLQQAFDKRNEAHASGAAILPASELCTPPVGLPNQLTFIFWQ